MLTGLPPYYSRDREELFKSIRYAELSIPSYVKLQSRDFLRALLQRNPDDRLGSAEDAVEVKGHEFFAGISWEKVELQFFAGISWEKVNNLLQK